MKKFLQKHLGKIILGIIITVAVAHFIVNFELVRNTKLIEQSWINLINGCILIITMSTGLIFLIWLAFSMSKETARDLERFLLKNLTTACFLLIFFFILQGKTLGLDGQSILTAIGAIIVFWYGYKTYERDKELQLIERYTDKYNKIYDEIIQKLMDKDNEVYLCKVDFKDIFNLWYEEFFLYSKGYISEDLWVEWLFWIKQDIKLIINKTCDQYIKIEELSEKDNKDYTIASVLTGLNSIIPMSYFKEIKNNQEIGYGFKKLMIGIIKGEIDGIGNNKGISKAKKDWYKILSKGVISMEY